MARKFEELRKKMTPEQRKKAKALAREKMTEMLLAEIRNLVGLTQEEVAEKLGIRQSSLSQLEKQSEMQIGTLQRLVKALGGDLELIVHLPGGDVRIGQFKEAS